jgi:hypothetical protein
MMTYALGRVLGCRHGVAVMVMADALRSRILGGRCVVMMVNARLGRARGA